MHAGERGFAERRRCHAVLSLGREPPIFAQERVGVDRIGIDRAFQRHELTRQRDVHAILILDPVR